jgi:hypothetical protein
MRRIPRPVQLPPVRELSPPSELPAAPPFDPDGAGSGAYRSAYPPVEAADGSRAGASLLTYGKDGRVRRIKGHNAAVTRPLPLQRTSQAVNPAPHINSAPALADGGVQPQRQPLMERAQPASTLRPPIGASPGELRLWKQRHGVVS